MIDLTEHLDSIHLTVYLILSTALSFFDDHDHEVAIEQSRDLSDISK